MSKLPQNLQSHKHSVNKRKFSFVKFFICLHVLFIHRKTFDKLYRQDYKLTWRDKPILWYYALIFKLYDDFRPYLKHLKPLLIRAYNQKRATIKQQLSFWHIRKINVERYSSYVP